MWLNHVISRNISPEPIFTGRTEVVAKVIFLHLSVIHSVHRGEGVCLSACWDTPLGADTSPPPERTPPRADNPPGADTPPPESRLQHRVYERPVRVLLECILVNPQFGPNKLVTVGNRMWMWRLKIRRLLLFIEHWQCINQRYTA